MLTTQLLHPEILRAVAACGHGDQILITDGNYPLASNVNPQTEKVYLGLKPGLPKVTDVLASLASVLNFESVKVMTPGTATEPEIYGEFKQILDLPLTKLDRQAFYDECQQATNLKLGINTGETRVFANILLTVAPATND